LENVEQLAVVQVPLPHFAQPSGFAAGGKKEASVRRKRHAVDVAAMAFEDLDDGAGFRGAHLDFAIAARRDPFTTGIVSERVDRIAGRNRGLNTGNDERLGLDFSGWHGARGNYCVVMS